jgi:steroid delta-isomerase-like uncharacterized protein
MKTYLCVVPLVLLFCFTIACQDKGAMADLQKFKAQAKVEEQNKALVNRMWDEAWGKVDSEAFKELVAPEYLFYLPLNTKPWSRVETIEGAKMMRKSFPDLNFRIEEIDAVKDRVISRFIVRGTHQGEFEGIPATGNKIEISGIMITRIEKGKIVEDKEDWDGLGLMQQLGMELKPMEAKKK